MEQALTRMHAPITEEVVDWMRLREAVPRIQVCDVKSKKARPKYKNCQKMFDADTKEEWVVDGGKPNLVGPAWVSFTRSSHIQQDSKNKWFYLHAGAVHTTKLSHSY